jgi:excinuclease UvrABC nuclease subunit
MSHLLKESGVYFLTFAEHSEHIKIGVARELKARLSAYKTHTPFTVEIIHFIKASYQVDDPLNAKVIEKQFHKQFIHLWHKGEWYKNQDDLKEFIEEQNFESFYFL